MSLKRWTTVVIAAASLVTTCVVAVAPAPRVEAATVTVLSGLGAAPSGVVWSPSGAWRAVRSGNQVFRSSDGTSWSSTSVPVAGGRVGVGDAGELVQVVSVGTTGVFVYRYDGSQWAGPSTILSSAFITSSVYGVVTDGSVWVASVQSQGARGLFYSLNGGATWTLGAGSTDFAVAAVTVIGSKVHGMSQFGYLRWDIPSKTVDIPLGTASGSPTVGRMFSAPGSTTDVWSVGAVADGKFSAWHSTNAGQSWVNVVSNGLVPLRVANSMPAMYPDGDIHFVGTATEGGVVVVYESIWDTTSGQWSVVSRSASTVAAGSLLDVSTQRANGSIVDSGWWLSTPSSLANLTGDRVPAPWPVTSQSSSPTAVLSGLGAAPSGVVWSPSGAWRAVAVGSDVWRSSNGAVWEKVPLPVAGGRVGVGDAGELVQVVSVGTTGVFVYRFDGVQWFNRSTILSSAFITSSVYGVVTDGSVWVASVQSQGARGLFYSLNGGATWTLGAGSTDFAVAAVTVIGSKVHGMSQFGYLRWDIPSKTVDIPLGTASGSPTVGRMFSAPGSTTDVWSVGAVADGKFSAWHSTNAGQSWVNVVSNGLVPLRVANSMPAMYPDGDIHFVGTATEGGVVVVYESIWDTTSGQWSVVSRSASTVAAGSLLDVSTQRANGSIVDSGWWLSTPSSLANLTGDRVPAPWPVTSQSSSPTAVLSGLGAAPSGVVWSPSGAWRAVAVGSDVWRSSNGAVWEKVPLPVAGGRVGVGDAGELVQVVSVGTTGVFVYRFDGVQWFNRSTILSSAFITSSVYGVVTDGSVWVASVQSQGPRGLFYSLNGGATWTLGAGSTDFAVAAVTVIGSKVHGMSQFGYLRWDIPSKTVDIPLGTASPGWKVFRRLDTSTTSLAYGGTGVTLYNWQEPNGPFVQADSDPLPAGMSSTTFHQSSDNQVRYYSTAVCSSATLVYGAAYDVTTGTISPQAVPLYLDESKTAALVGVPTGGNAVYPDGWEAWFRMGSAGAYDLVRIGGVLTSPEAVFGFDGYGLTARNVNAAIGSFVYANTDVSIAGVGPQLAVTRTYNSADRRQGIFGRGWTSTFETRVFENCVNGAVTILRSDGRREYHYPNGTGGYTPAPGYTSTLVKTGTTGWTLTETDGTVQTFRSDGRLTQIKDADTQALNLTWNASNQLTVVTDATSGRTLTFSYVNGRVTSVTTSPVTVNGVTTPLTWTYHYNGSNLAKVCDARNNDPVTGYCTTYTTANNAITEVIDANGHIDKKIGYSGGKVAWEENGVGDRTVFSYSATETTITDPHDNTTRSQFDSQFRLVKVIDPLNNETVHEYNAQNFRWKTTSPVIGSTTRTFDAKGNVLSETNGENETTWFAYDTFNNVTEIRDGRSSGPTDNTYLVTRTWDGVKRNQLSESTPPTTQQPSGTSRHWTYTTGSESAIGGGTTPAGLLKTEIDARNHTTFYAYDSTGNLRRVTDRAGLVTEYTYDQLGRRISEKVFADGYAQGLLTTTALDALGNPVTITLPATTNRVTNHLHQRRIVNTFDGVSNLTVSVQSDIGGSPSADPSRTTSTTFDNADRPRFVDDAESGTWETVYDAAGNVSAQIDPLGRRHDFEYDERNLLTTEFARDVTIDENTTTPRDVRLQFLSYDDAGRLETSTDPLGRVLEYGYDNANRQTTVTLKTFGNRDSTTRDIVVSSMTYDDAGNPTQLVSGGGLRTEVSVFDEARMLVSTTLDPAGLNRTQSYVYDPNGNVLIESLSDAARSEETRIEYDPENRVVSETVENGTVDLTTTYDYDNRGALEAMVEPAATSQGQRRRSIESASSSTSSVTRRGNLSGGHGLRGRCHNDERPTGHVDWLRHVRSDHSSTQRTRQRHHLRLRPARPFDAGRSPAVREPARRHDQCVRDDRVRRGRQRPHVHRSPRSGHQLRLRRPQPDDPPNRPRRRRRSARGHGLVVRRCRQRHHGRRSSRGTHRVHLRRSEPHPHPDRRGPQRNQHTRSVHDDVRLRRPRQPHPADPPERRDRDLRLLCGVGTDRGHRRRAVRDHLHLRRCRSHHRRHRPDEPTHRNRLRPRRSPRRDGPPPRRRSSVDPIDSHIRPSREHDHLRRSTAATSPATRQPSSRPPTPTTRSADWSASSNQWTRPRASPPATGTTSPGT